jgi:ATP-dependent DNA helicase PIF1
MIFQGNEISPDQQVAIDAIAKERGPFYLTGPAGSGKSFLVEYLRSVNQNCIVSAMTGVAAQLIRGKTAHSVLGIHPSYGVISAKKFDDRIRGCQMLIIDEISMASARFFGQILTRFGYANKVPKLIMVGDFHQLPPIRPRDPRDRRADPGDRIFTAEEWSIVTRLQLVQQHRQRGDVKFITALNSIRSGTLTEDTKEFLSHRLVDSLPEDCIHLHSTRNVVEQRNIQRLEALPGTVRTYDWRVGVVDTKKKKADPKYLDDCRFVNRLELKVGARVVLLTNAKEWVNGSTGSITQLNNDSIHVNLDRGGHVFVPRAEMEILDENNKPVFKVTQFPMMLAFSLTIHKAQGMTLDRVGIDLNGHFEAGQTYVALSRCRYYDGLFLKGHLQSTALVDPEVVEYETTGKVAKTVKALHRPSPYKPVPAAPVQVAKPVDDNPPPWDE